MLFLETSVLYSSFQELQFVWWPMGCGPSERDGKERDRFWNNMDRILDRVGNGCRLCALGDLNGWIGYRARAGINALFQFY